VLNDNPHTHRGMDEGHSHSPNTFCGGDCLEKVELGAINDLVKITPSVYDNSATIVPQLVNKQL
jgi:hypothetical protein